MTSPDHSPAAAADRQAAMDDTDKTVFMIVFDDHDRKPEIVIGETRAAYRFGEVSVSWNAHLFGKIKSNSRDDPRFSDNVRLASPPPAAAAEEQVNELMRLVNLYGDVCHEQAREAALYPGDSYKNHQPAVDKALDNIRALATRLASPPSNEAGKWMPKEPTEAMCVAGWNAYVDDMKGGIWRFAKTYRAMYEAAPPGESGQQRNEAPIDMILLCPKCGVQHVDAPEDKGHQWQFPTAPPDQWTNPPHKSHLCHGCGCIWRPADVPTNGVAAISTRGKADNWAPGESTVSAPGSSSTGGSGTGGGAVVFAGGLAGDAFETVHRLTSAPDAEHTRLRNEAWAEAGKRIAAEDAGLPYREAAKEAHEASDWRAAIRASMKPTNLKDAA